MRVARSSRLLAFVLLLMVGLAALPVSPVAAANCSAIGPGANLSGCDLSGLDLSGVNLSGANLRSANLTGTNLDGANLSGANLSNTRITTGALDAANTSGANLRGIRWVPGAVIRIDPVLPNETIFCGFEITLLNFAVGTYTVEIESEIFSGLAGTFDVTLPQSETWVFTAEAIEPVGPTLDVAVVATNTETGVARSATAEIACRVP
jgi:hypothetical protein